MTDISQTIIEKEFRCRRCNECCRQPGFVYLQKGEAERIAAFLNLEIYDFTDRFCDFQERTRLVLKKKEGETCIFLENDGCSIHSVKPGQCLDFPVKWRTVKSFNYCIGLKTLNGGK